MPSEPENQKEESEKRDIDLENIVGNLMIAEYQVQKLRSKVSKKIGKYGYATDKKVSSHMFKDDRRWFKISVKVEELAIDKTNRTYAWERNFLISAKLYPVPFLPVKKRFGGK